jgi:hypothetical protein
MSRKSLRIVAITVTLMSVVTMAILHEQARFWREHYRQKIRRFIRAQRELYDERTTNA